MKIQNVRELVAVAEATTNPKELDRLASARKALPLVIDAIIANPAASPTTLLGIYTRAQTRGRGYGVPSSGEAFDGLYARVLAMKQQPDERAEAARVDFARRMLALPANSPLRQDVLDRIDLPTIKALADEADWRGITAHPNAMAQLRKWADEMGYGSFPMEVVLPLLLNNPS